MSDQKRFVLENVEVEWFRLLGEPHQNYNKDGTEWTCNFLLTDEHMEVCKANGMAKAYIRTTKKEKGKEVPCPPHIKFVKKGTKANGDPAKEPDVRDRYGDFWDSRTLVGNGSTADIVVMLNMMDRGPNQGKLKPFVIKTVIRDHVPYEVDDGIEYDKKEATQTAAKPETHDDMPQEDEDDWD